MTHRIWARDVATGRNIGVVSIDYDDTLSLHQARDVARGVMRGIWAERPQARFSVHEDPRKTRLGWVDLFPHDPRSAKDSERADHA